MPARPKPDTAPRIRKPAPKPLLESLAKVRALVESRTVTRICYSHHAVKIPPSHVLYLRKWVNNCLAPHYYLEHWLRQHVGFTPEPYLVEEDAKRMKEVRLAWLDWMAEEIRKELSSTTTKE